MYCVLLFFIYIIIICIYKNDDGEESVLGTDDPIKRRDQFQYIIHFKDFLVSVFLHILFLNRDYQIALKKLFTKGGKGGSGGGGSKGKRTK